MLTDLIEIHFIELPKFVELKDKNLKENKLQRWLTFFKEDISDEELRELMEMDKDIKRVEEKIEYLSSDPEPLAVYRAREKSLNDRTNMISSAKEEGKIEMAKNLLLMGIDIKAISKASGVEISEIEKLQH